MKLPLMIAAALLSGCTYSVHMQHISDIDPLPAAAERSVVVASASQKVVLGLVFETDYVDVARERLLAQCPGQIAAVSTQFSTAHGFLHWDNTVRMEGICVN